MVDELRKILLLGIGSAAYTYEKATKVVDDMVQKGRLTVEEGKELSEELKRTTKEKTEKSEAKPLTKEDMVDLFKQMDFATKDDLSELKERLSKLEAEKASE